MYQAAAYDAATPATSPSPTTCTTTRCSSRPASASPASCCSTASSRGLLYPVVRRRASPRASEHRAHRVSARSGPRRSATSSTSCSASRSPGPRCSCGCVAVVLAPTASDVEVRRRAGAGSRPASRGRARPAAIGLQRRLHRGRQYYLTARIAATGVSARTPCASTKTPSRLNPFNDMYRAEVGLALPDEMIECVRRPGRSQAGRIPASDGRRPRWRSMAGGGRVQGRRSRSCRPSTTTTSSSPNLYNSGAVPRPRLLRERAQDRRQGHHRGAVRAGDPVPACSCAPRAGNRADEAIHALEPTVKMDPVYSTAAMLLRKAYVKRLDRPGRGAQEYYSTLPDVVRAAGRARRGDRGERGQRFGSSDRHAVRRSVKTAADGPTRTRKKGNTEWRDRRDPPRRPGDVRGRRRKSGRRARLDSAIGLVPPLARSCCCSHRGGRRGRLRRAR